jgi:tetratricopeptide (TPR) repeat protein
MSVLLLTFALAIQAPAATPPPTDVLARAYQLFLEGQALDDADDLAGAIGRYRQALEILPGASEIRAELASALARRDQIDEARAEAEQALVGAPTSRTAHRVLGLIDVATVPRTPRLEMTSRGVQAAIGHFEQVLTGGFQDLTVQLGLSDLYVRTGQAAKAIPLLTRFLDARPNYPQAVLLLAQAYREAGQPEEADKLLGSLGIGGGGRARAGASLQEQAEEHERSGRWREAADTWARVVAESPGGPARLRYATALANSRDLDRARQVLQEATTASPDDIAAWYLLAQVEQRRGDHAAAEAAAARIVTLDPDDSRGPLMLAEVRAARGDFKGAAKALDGPVAAARNDDIASGAYLEMVTLLSRALLAADEKRRAVQVLEKARERAPQEQEILYRLAATYEQAENFDRAEQAFRDLIRENPEHDQALNYLGYMLAERGRKLDEAVTLITRALALDADNPAYLDSLGWAYYRLSRYDEALSPLERAASAIPDSSVIQDHLGDLYVQLKRYADAAAAFDRALEGDRDGVDAGAIQKKRDRARSMTTGKN